jgi:L-alanine-DL-glutamate epimerase-like enolase superfamily enzyme
MKVTGVETIRLDEHPQMLWVEIHTDEGLTGLGETCLGPATVEAHIHETVAPYLIGKDPGQIEAHWRTLYDVFVGYQGTGAETRGNSATDIALWDLLGQSTGRPLVDLFGGPTRESIRIYNTCAGYRYGRDNTGALKASDRASESDRGLRAPATDKPYEDLLAAIERPGELAQSLLDQNIRAMKIWPFDSYAASTGGYDISPADLRAGVGVIEAIRDAVGSAMDVMVEMHAVWHLPAAVKIAKAVEPLEPYWFEDPVKADNLSAAARFAAETHIPVAMGETLAGRWTFQRLIEVDAARVLMFDLGWVGGISEARKIATMAEAHDLPIAPHDCTGPVVLTASTHLATSAPNALLQETVRAYYTDWYRDIVTELPTIRDGYIAPPTGAGLGIRLRPEVKASSTTRTRVTTARDLA